MSVLVHVGWEGDSQPLLDETMFYLDWVLENVSYAELLCAANLWVNGEYLHLCGCSLTGTSDLLEAL